MLSKFIKPGDKVELRAVDSTTEELLEDKGKVYSSRVHDILSEDSLEITMPLEKTKLILLPVDSEYDLIFYCDGGLYECVARIIDRYKSNNVYLLVVELTSNLRKYQRREYYRFSCALDMCARELVEEEIEAIENNKPYTLTPGLPLRQCVIVDISGGGLRFVSEQKYEQDSLIYISYNLVKDGVIKKYEVFGRVLSVRQPENRQETWEHRIEYYGMSRMAREEIIRYIFEEERKNRKKERFT